MPTLMTGATQRPGMTDRGGVTDLATPEEARRVFAALDVGGGQETVALDAARARVLAERVTADMDVPGFDRASMDGYAVRAADTDGATAADPVDLTVVEHVAAGEAPRERVDAGQATAIATGAPIPPGADAVVMVEETADRDGRVQVHGAVAPGEHVMPAGSDLAAGDWVLAAGTRLTPRTVGLLAALGRESVPVRRAPVVGVVATGPELVQPGAVVDHRAGQIYDVNTSTLAAAVADAGGEARTYQPPTDDPSALRTALTTAAADCDLVLTAGSTSAGAGDLLPTIAAEEGEVLLHGVAIKPGKPTLVGRVAETPYVGLPGYPVSALSIFRVFVAPQLRAAAGLPPETAPSVSATLALDERFEGDRHRATPVGLVADGNGDLLAYVVDRGSGATTSLGYADGVVEMAAETDLLAAGTDVTVAVFADDARPPGLLAVGEPDPAATALLDGSDRPRYLTRGSATGERWLVEGVADVAVCTDVDALPEGAVEAARWEREWGLVAPTDGRAPDGLAGLVDRAPAVILDADFGLRVALDAALDDAVDAGDVAAADRDSLLSRAVQTRGVESPARRVARGDAAVGLGLRTTAEALDLAFVPVGRQPVSLLVAGDRRGKDGVAALERAVAGLDEVVSTLAGYEPA